MNAAAKASASSSRRRVSVPAPGLGKWERVGELLKGSEKALDKTADPKQAFRKRTFYLGKDTLYYINKGKPSPHIGRGEGCERGPVV